MRYMRGRRLGKRRMTRAERLKNMRDGWKKNVLPGVWLNGRAYGLEQGIFGIDVSDLGRCYILHLLYNLSVRLYHSGLLSLPSRQTISCIYCTG